MKKFKAFRFFRLARALVLVLLVACLLAGAGLGYTIRQSWPQTSQKLQVPGLMAPVEVWRDRWGVPHLYANNTHDLFLAQGYVHAQDRFWQMDVWRHIGSGRLAEMFGKSQLATDQFLRTLGWARVAQTELTQMPPEELAILQAYAEGVNAYLANHQGSALSLEYTVLGALNREYRPEPWQPLHTLTWGKVMAWDLGKNMKSEIERSLLLKTLKPEQVEALFPAYPADQPLILGDQTKRTSTALPGLSPPLARQLSPALSAIATPIAALEDLVGPTGSGIGSNSWVVGGQHTATGKPLLANDPHLGVQLPSIWYEVGLHCNASAVSPAGTTPPDKTCPYDMVGFSFAGTPGIVVGHNNRIAWGVTNVGQDVMDLYIEKINPQNPNQYEVDGQWVEMQVVNETIQVAGQDPVTQAVRYTRHGPIISETYGELKDFNQTAGIPVPSSYAIALRWTALEPSTLLSSILALDRAQTWSEFRQAARRFDTAGQNLIYADIDGNIGYQMPGNVPIRSQGNGRYPVPGWIKANDWQGYIPFDQLPTSFNPESGYLVTANNAVVGADYPHLITTDWDYGFRAERIQELLAGQNRPLSLTDMQQIQGDNKDLNAATLVPILLNTPLKNSHLDQVRTLLTDWDFQQARDQAAPALFAAFWKHLLADTFHDNLPPAYLPDGGDRWFEVMRHLVKEPNSFWWDNTATRPVETRDTIFRQAFAEAVQDLEQRLGKDPQQWRWGDLHTVTFRNTTLGKSGVAPIERLLNRGPFSTSGGSSLVNATAWNAAQSFEVYWLPSMRMIVDLSNFQNSLAVNSTGESGHAFHPHYSDMVEPWRNLQHLPMLWDRQVIQSPPSQHLTLQNDPT